MSGSMTWEQILALTTIAVCEDCKLDHAPVRSCAETQQAHAVMGGAS